MKDRAAQTKTNRGVKVKLFKGKKKSPSTLEINLILKHIVTIISNDFYVWE
jgi:hypothetical protein